MFPSSCPCCVLFRLSPIGCNPSLPLYSAFYSRDCRAHSCVMLGTEWAMRIGVGFYKDIQNIIFQKYQKQKVLPFVIRASETPRGGRASIEQRAMPTEERYQLQKDRELCERIAAAAERAAAAVVVLVAANETRRPRRGGVASARSRRRRRVRLRRRASASVRACGKQK